MEFGKFNQEFQINIAFEFIMLTMLAISVGFTSKNPT